LSSLLETFDLQIAKSLRDIGFDLDRFVLVVLLLITFWQDFCNVKHVLLRLIAAKVAASTDVDCEI